MPHKKDDHYYIEKKEEHSRVVVKLHQLKEGENRLEIARMLSGDRHSEVSLHQADELLAAAQEIQ